MKGKASTFVVWTKPGEAKDVYDVSSGVIVAAMTALAVDLILGGIATILYFYRPL